jgi:hypothetical protein
MGFAKPGLPHGVFLVRSSQARFLKAGWGGARS